MSRLSPSSEMDEMRKGRGRNVFPMRLHDARRKRMIGLKGQRAKPGRRPVICPGQAAYIEGRVETQPPRALGLDGGPGSCNCPPLEIGLEDSPHPAAMMRGSLALGEVFVGYLRVGVWGRSSERRFPFVSPLSFCQRCVRPW